MLSLTKPPLLITSALKGPLDPISNVKALDHIDPDPATTTVFELALELSPMNPPALESDAPLVTSTWLNEENCPTVSGTLSTWLAVPARMSHVAGVPPAAPTNKGTLSAAPRVMSVPPLNRKALCALVR